MKKILALVVTLMLVIGCAGLALAEEKTTVTIWTTGSQNVQDLFTELCATYNAKEDAKFTAVNQHIMSGTGGEGLDARIAAAYQTNQTNTDFDLIVENTADFQRYIDQAGSEDLFLPYADFNIAGVENVTVTPIIMPDRLVPYRCTTVVFAYDADRVPEEELPTPGTSCSPGARRIRAASPTTSPIPAEPAAPSSVPRSIASSRIRPPRSPMTRCGPSSTRPACSGWWTCIPSCIPPAAACCIPPRTRAPWI